MTTDLNEWYEITVSTSMNGTGRMSWTSTGSIFQRKEPKQYVTTLYGVGGSSNSATQDVIEKAMQSDIIKQPPSENIIVADFQWSIIRRINILHIAKAP